MLELSDFQTIPLKCDNLDYITLLGRHVCQSYYRSVSKVMLASNGYTCVGGIVTNLERRHLQTE